VGEKYHPASQQNKHLTYFHPFIGNSLPHAFYKIHINIHKYGTVTKCLKAGTVESDWKLIS
jgi:hypothetical protein